MIEFMVVVLVVVALFPLEGEVKWKEGTWKLRPLIFVVIGHLVQRLSQPKEESQTLTQPEQESLPSPQEYPRT